MSMTTTELVKYTKKLQLLYVDDDLSINESSISLFNNFFGNVVLAKNGQEALDIFKDTHFDLIITDISMPKMNGVEFIEKVRDLNSKINIIVYTAHSSADKRQACEALKIDAYMYKPMELSEIKEVLVNIIIKNEIE